VASVLETFFILFESNADDVDKGNQQAKKSSDDLERSLKSVDGATATVGSQFVNMLQVASGAIASVLSLAAVTGAVFKAADYADDLNDFTQRLGVNIEEVSAWGDAVAVNGGSAEGFRASIDSLSDALTTFAVKGNSRIAPFFKELGIDMVDANGKARDVMSILPELADAFEGLTRQESAALGRKLGLDQGTIILLQQGRREVDAQIARQKELGVVTQVNADIAANFNDQWDDTAKTFRSVAMALGGAVLPAFTRILQGVQSVASYLAKHSDFIVGIFVAIGAAAGFYLIPVMYRLAAATLVAFAPYLLMGAAIAAVGLAFALAYDDIMNFIDGNDSLIGQIMTDYPAIAAIVNFLIDVIKNLWSTVEWVFNSIVSLLEISVAGWRLLFGTINDGIRDFVANSAFLQAAIALITEAFGVMGDSVGGIWDRLTEKVMVFIGWVRQAMQFATNVAGAFSAGLDNLKGSLGIGGLGEGKAALSTATNSAIGSQTSNSIANSSRTSNRSTSVQTGPITVQTQATDADGIAGAIGSSLGTQMRAASASFDDGVAG
jgi:hypothetical protein